MHGLPLVTTIAAAFASAWVLGLLTQRIGLSPIVGYLLAGVVIGPHTPGFVGDLHLAQQLAEIGVILLMFGVGLHFDLADLLAVRKVAIPGAIGQSAVATSLGIGLGVALGWPWSHGLVLGIALSVASTVVLMRVLMDHGMLQSPHGHVAVGWLVVEDLLTVIVLVMLPVLAGDSSGATGGRVWLSLGWTLLKLAILGALFGFAGARIVPWVMVRVARLQSRELFTLTVLVMGVAVAAGASQFFGASLALGAFLAGMVVGQSPVSQQAAADALPMRDAFAALFFVSVGMLFDPRFLVAHPILVAAALGIVLIGKPLAALGIVLGLGYSVRTALVVATGLAQVGEFSFIVADLARRFNVLSLDGQSALIVAAIFSIAMNPLLFRAIEPIESALKRRPALWRRLESRGERRSRALNLATGPPAAGVRRAVIVGYGPVGQTVERLLREAGMETLVIDLNMDTVLAVREKGRKAIYGDASNSEILEAAGVRAAGFLVATLPHSTNRVPLITAARQMNPDLRILVRSRYLTEARDLEEAGANGICIEEEEAAVALAQAVLRETGVATGLPPQMEDRLRRELHQTRV